MDDGFRRYGQDPTPALEADPARDEVLRTAIQAFFEDRITSDQLEQRLREYGGRFEEKPYKVAPAAIDWMKVPQECIFALLRVTSRIIEPTQQAYFNGEVTTAQAAVRIALFFLIWPGHGMDPPKDADPATRQRVEQLMRAIGDYWAP
jgi:hypothetical protein